MTRERIKDFKEIVLPFFTNYLLKKNHENLGKSDAEEFEKDFSEIIELADKALEQQPCEDTISRKAAVNALWKALYEYENKTEKQFLESEDLDIYDWMVHRIFVQNMSDIDRRTILDLPSAERQKVQSNECEYWDNESNFCTLHRPSAERRGQWKFNIDDKGWSWDEPYVCDQCGKWNGIETPYCPNCGARMEGEKE